MYNEIKRKLRYLNSEFDDLSVSLEGLKELDQTLPMNMKQGKQLYQSLQALKIEFNATWERIERIRFNKNSISPIEFEEIEEFDTTHSDPFLQAVDISENLFTCYTVLLPSVSVRAIVNQEYIPVRAMMNLEPKIHLITNSCRERLNLPLNPLRPIFDPTQESLTGIVGMTALTICPHYNMTPPITFEAYVTQNPFANTPMQKVHDSVRQQLLTYVLCDPQFDVPGDIELTINMAQLPNYVNTLQKYRVPGTHCSAFNTIFGWAVTGMAPVEEIRRSLWVDRLIEEINEKIQCCEEFFTTYYPCLTN